MFKLSLVGSISSHYIATYPCTRCFIKQYRSISSFKNKEYSEYFKILNISEKSDQHAAREAFLKLAKKFHPDSKNAEASAENFQNIEHAYKKVLEKFSQDRRNNDCEGEFGLYYEQKRQGNVDENITEEIFDIKHTAPQHRQYLSYEGIGIGTPSQRQKQFTKYKAMKAAENIIDYKIQRLGENKEETAVTTKDKKAARDIRTRYGIDRLVEDKIQESIARGDFDNLPNAGKPLQFQNHNPFVDSVTHKLNQVLIENGYAPEWVMLEKEIRDERSRIKKKLENCRCKLDMCPLTAKEMTIWTNVLSSLSSDVAELNRTIDKYNLVVPLMTKQTVHFPLAKIGEKILREGRTKHQTNQEEEANNEVFKKEIHSKSTKEEFGIRAIIGIFKGR